MKRIGACDGLDITKPQTERRHGYPQRRIPKNPGEEQLGITVLCDLFMCQYILISGSFVDDSMIIFYVQKVDHKVYFIYD